MPYQNLKVEGIQPRTLWQTFNHIDGMLADLYAFYRITEKQRERHRLGSGKFTTTLVLCCLLDALATDIWPRRNAHKEKQKKQNQTATLIKLLEDWFPYDEGPDWVPKSDAIKTLIEDLRNPFVHTAGRDDPKKRHSALSEPVIWDWYPVPKTHGIDKVLFRASWPEDWPLLKYDKKGPKKRRHGLCNLALFWAVRRVASNLLNDAAVMADAKKFHLTEYPEPNKESDPE